MGKLYDRRDFEFDMAELDKLEAELSSKVLAGTFPARKLPQTVEMFETERRRCKMQLLRTGQLMADLKHAQRVWRACPKCFTTKEGKQRGCVAHALMLNRAKSAVYWAGKDNEGRRAAAGTTRDDDEGAHDGSLNKWETWYFKDRREGVWPGRSPEELAYNKEHFGGLDYRGWLHMLHDSAEEISDLEMSEELARLRGGTT